MRIYPYQVAGQDVTVKVPETREDLNEFKRWIIDANNRGPIALDTETTGLDIYSDTYRLRTVQFGDARTGWVIHWERAGWFQEVVTWVFRRIRPHFLIHNAPFDWCVLDRHAGESIESLAPRTTDTRLLAGLIDPRQPQEGGRGTALKPLCAWYVDPSAPDTQGDLTAVFRSLKLTKETGWAGIPLDHPTYNLYAGLDVILTARLEPALRAELEMLSVSAKLVQYEHELARICSIMQRRGLVLDVDYTRQLQSQLMHDELEFTGVAARYGVANVNAPKQIAEALAGMGEILTETTASGNVKVDKAVLHRLADLDFASGEPLGSRTPNPLAEAILKSKRAGKWRSSYADTFLETVDADGRVHCFINSMRARTGRMSITRPALQTLPSRDQMIRRALLAEPGHVMVSTDFKAVELRVLAAIGDVKRMKQAIAQGADLHAFTASMVYGPDFTKDQRENSKKMAFGTVYGGGLAALERQTGAPRAELEAALGAFHRAYPEIKRMSNRMQREAYETGMVHVSVTGRRLPLDRHRTYAVINYAVQSAARDVLGQSLLNIEEAGLLDTMRLPIHDEVLASVPAAEAEDYAREIERCMTFDLFGVPIEAEAEIGKRSWGSLYGADV